MMMRDGSKGIRERETRERETERWEHRKGWSSWVSDSEDFARAVDLRRIEEREGCCSGAGSDDR
jgi:hypothetical protein